MILDNRQSLLRIPRPYEIILYESTVNRVSWNGEGFGYWDDTSHAWVIDGLTTSKIKNAVHTQLEDLYPNYTLIYAKASDEENGQFRNFVPETPAGNVANFQLVYDINYPETNAFDIYFTNSGADLTLRIY